MNYIPNYIDRNKKIILGIHTSIKIQNIFEYFDTSINAILLDDEIIFKGQTYYQILFNSEITEQKLKSYCKKFQKNGFVSYYTSYRDRKDHINVGVVLFDPKKSRSQFYLTGIFDVKCDIFFPKLNVISNNPLCPIFGSINIPLPTTIQLFNESLEINSIYLCDSLELSQDVRKEIAGRILYATFIYHPSRIWKNGEVPDDLSNIIPKNNVYSNTFNVFHHHISKNEYEKRNNIKEDISTTFYFKKNEITSKIEKYLVTYPNITQNGIKDFFKFLSDMYYRKNDEKFKKEEVIGFLSLISKFITNGKVKTKLTKNGVILEYHLNT